MHAFADPTSQAMEDARKRNIMAIDLAMKPVPYNADLLPRRFGFELKCAGIGLLDVNGYVQSLNGVDFMAALNLMPELTAIREAFGRPMVLHGEYIEGAGFEAALSAFNRGEGTGAVMLWDAVPLSVWHGHEISQPLIERRAALAAAIQIAKPKAVGLLQWVDISSAADVTSSAAQAIELGQEGIVVKDMDSPYVRGPSPYWMKVKGVETVDVPIQAAHVEDQRLTKIVVTVDGKPNVVAVGFTEDQRHEPAEFWAGRIVEIKHNGFTKGGLLRGATFVRFRDDKAVRS